MAVGMSQERLLRPDMDPANALMALDRGRYAFFFTQVTVIGHEYRQMNTVLPVGDALEYLPVLSTLISLGRLPLTAWYLGRAVITYFRSPLDRQTSREDISLHGWRMVRSTVALVPFVGNAGISAATAEKIKRMLPKMAYEEGKTVCYIEGEGGEPVRAGDITAKRFFQLTTPSDPNTVTRLVKEFFGTPPKSILTLAERYNHEWFERLATYHCRHLPGSPYFYLCRDDLIKMITEDSGEEIKEASA